MTSFVPPGVPASVQLLRVQNLTGGPFTFEPGSMLGASIASGSSLLPVVPVVVEGPTSQGSVTRLLMNVNALSAQELGYTSTVRNALMVMNTPYSADPSTLSFGNRLLSRGTGGQLVAANPIYSEGAVTNDDGERFGQDMRAFLYAVDTATPTQAVRLEATAAGALIVSAGGASSAITTVADATGVGGTATSLAAANTGRTQVVVQNIGATNAARVGDTNITTTRGIRLAPGESVTLETTAQIFGLSEAGTTDFAVTELE